MTNFHWAALTMFVLGTIGVLWAEWVGRQLRKDRKDEEARRAARERQGERDASAPAE